MTLTEIEVYDTDKPPDPVTGERPLKARIRQTHGDENRESDAVILTAEGNAEVKTEAEQTFDGGTLNEVTVTATGSPNLWERIKEGVQWAIVLILPATAGWIVITSTKSKKNG